MERRLLLDIIIRKGAPIFELLASKDKTLLIWWDAFLVLNLRLHVVNRVRRLDLQRDGLARKGLDKDLHTTTETKDEVKSRFLLDVVVRECASVFELLACENEALLIRWNTKDVIVSCWLRNEHV